MKKNSLLLYLFVAVFGVIGIYLTFVAGNVQKYDSQTTAYKIDANEHYDSDGTMYYPIYYFKVRGESYKCESKSGSNSVPNESKNKVYYDSKNPTKCMTQYEKSTSKFIGIIFLAFSVILIVLLMRKPSDKVEKKKKKKEIDPVKQQQIEENVLKVTSAIEKIALIVKRVILGIIILVLLLFILFETLIIKQTIKAKDYIETTATYVMEKENSEDNVFNEHIYSFEDTHGNKQEIIVSVSKTDTVKNTIKIKYNKNNPQEFYEEGMTYGKSGIIWYVVKIVVLIALVVLFFNKKLLSKVSISLNGN